MTMDRRVLVPIERPFVTVDLVILTVRNDRLEVLLVRRPATTGEPYPGLWALPGGFIDVGQDATLEDCARRKLREKTGVESPYLEQLGSDGSASRDPRGWSVTQVYFALIPDEGIALRPGGNADTAAWWSIPEGSTNLGMDLAFDHAALLTAALERLRSKVEYTSLPAFLLPREFTLPELQRAYEIVLGREVEKSAFRRRVLDAEVIRKIPKKTRLTERRPAQLYRLKDEANLKTFARAFGQGKRGG